MTATAYLTALHQELEAYHDYRPGMDVRSTWPRTQDLSLLAGAGEELMVTSQVRARVEGRLARERASARGHGPVRGVRGHHGGAGGERPAGGVMDVVRDPTWWFTSVGLALVIGIAAHFVSRFLDARLSRWWGRRVDARKRNRAKLMRIARQMRESDSNRIVGGIIMLRHLLIGSTFVLLGGVTIAASPTPAMTPYFVVAGSLLGGAGLAFVAISRLIYTAMGMSEEEIEAADPDPAHDGAG